MSHRELRNFSEILRVLGFPRLVSVENFRNPNFPLVAEVLTWLLARFDPDAEISNDIETEQDRVIFIKTIAQIFATKANLRLNTKKLYMADGHAVQEMLKVANVLYQAAKTTHQDQDNQDESQELDLQTLESTLSSKMSEVKKCRQLASELTQRGANLFDMLGQEIQLRSQRNACLARQLEIPEIEKAIRDAMEESKSHVQRIHNKIENVQSDESTLESKIEKKRAELERNQKRLEALKAVRPAFMDEMEKLEEELVIVYDLYVTRLRCLAFLERQQEEIEKAELEKMEQREAQIKQIVEQMRQQELLRSQKEDEVDQDLIPEPIDVLGAATDQIAGDAGRGKTGVVENGQRAKRSAITSRVRVYGSMTGDKEDSYDSDLDLDPDENDDGSELDSEDEMELMNLTKDTGDGSGGAAKPVRAKSARAQPPPANDSDNDF